MTIQRQTNPSGSNHSYDQRGALDWSAARIQAELCALPDAKRNEIIARARQRAEQRPASYLGKYIKTLYGL